MIFLKLYKLDRYRCLEILEGYIIGIQARKLLQTYWHRLTVVTRAEGYYGTSFRGERGVTPGKPLSPTIFIVVVDTVVRHWVKGVVEESEARGELGKEGRHQAALFYAADSMFTLSDPAWFQGAFNALSNRPTRALNAPWSQAGSDEATIPSSA